MIIHDSSLHAWVLMRYKTVRRQIRWIWIVLGRIVTAWSCKCTDGRNQERRKKNREKISMFSMWLSSRCLFTEHFYSKNWEVFWGSVYLELCNWPSQQPHYRSLVMYLLLSLVWFVNKIEICRKKHREKAKDYPLHRKMFENHKICIGEPSGSTYRVNSSSNCSGSGV